MTWKDPVGIGYISGPMSGYPEYNYPAFEAAAKMLREWGLTIVSPRELAKSSRASDASPWVGFMRTDLAAVTRCDYIIMLPGWASSAGAFGELFTAKMLGMDVLLLHQSSNQSPGDTWQLIRMSRPRPHGPVPEAPAKP